MEQVRKDLTKPKVVNRGENSRAEIEKNLRAMYEADQQPVRGVFKYYEVPGGFIELVYKKYKWDKLEKYTFYDNQIYTIPLGVAKHLNTNPKYSIYQYETDPVRGAVAVVGKKVSRMGFQSLEFMDFAEMNSDKEVLVSHSF